MFSPNAPINRSCVFGQRTDEVLPIYSEYCGMSSIPNGIGRAEVGYPSVVGNVRRVHQGPMVQSHYMRRQFPGQADPYDGSNVGSVSSPMHGAEHFTPSASIIGSVNGANGYHPHGSVYGAGSARGARQGVSRANVESYSPGAWTFEEQRIGHSSGSDPRMPNASSDMLENYAVANAETDVIGTRGYTVPRGMSAPLSSRAMHARPEYDEADADDVSGHYDPHRPDIMAEVERCCGGRMHASTRSSTNGGSRPEQYTGKELVEPSGIDCDNEMYVPGGCCNRTRLRRPTVFSAFRHREFDNVRSGF